MIFKLYRFVSSENAGSKLLFIFAAFGIVALINWPTIPTAAEATPFPFPKNSCLVYSVERFGSGSDIENFPREICFSPAAKNGFLEKESVLQTTFDKDGFADLTKEDIAIWKKSLKGDSDPFFESMASKLDFHNRYFAQPKLKPGIIFYDKYPVAKITQFNGKKTYMVETNPWTDTRLTHRGAISKLWFKLQFKYNRLIYKPTERRGGSRDVVERHYYNYDTGVLEGNEKLIVERSQDEKIISSALEERSTLQEIKTQ